MAELLTTDHLIRSRLESSPDTPILAYPHQYGDPESYVNYSVKQIDNFIENAASIFECSELYDESNTKIEYATVIGIIAPSGIELIISACALSRLGYTVLVLSPRLAATSSVALMDEVGCEGLMISDKCHGSQKEIVKLGSWHGKILPLPSRQSWSSQSISGKEKKTRLALDSDTRSRTAFILHSSGSTGRPKPIFTTHGRYLENVAHIYEFSAFMTLPLFHAYGFASFFRAVAGGTLLVLPDPTLPLTAEHITEVIYITQPRMLSVVPYTLKLLSEMPESLPYLRQLELVTFHGSSCPDEVGDLLVANGVNLVAHMGSTEAGALATSDRPKGDDFWNYLRFLPSVLPYVYMKPVDDGVNELVILDGLKTKVLSNSDDPPNSLHTRDLFRRHSKIPNAWYYLGRQDDRITLSNGEKVLPLPIESCVMENPYVRQAVVFGVGKDYPGIFVFRSKLAANLTDEEFIDSIWPIIDKANSHAEGFSQIAKSMVISMPSDSEFPRTDKGSAIRAQTYSKYSEEIERAYDEILQPHQKKRKLSLSDIQDYLILICNRDLRLPVTNLSENLFAAGLDSLKAAQLATRIRRDLDLDGFENKLGPRKIYQAENLKGLAELLYNPAQSPFSWQENGIVNKFDVVDKYASLRRGPSTNENRRPENHTLLLTGATGSLGSFILAQALSSQEFDHVYCLVRDKNDTSAAERVQNQIKKQGLSRAWNASKLTVLPSRLDKIDFDVSADVFQLLKETVTVIVHAAWDVNFNKPFSAFVQADIVGLHNLLQFSLDTAFAPAYLVFCSSVSVAARSNAETAVPEALMPNFTACSSSGYAQSKLVGEHITLRAREYGAVSCVVRIGQIIGGLERGIWNENEQVPLMVRGCHSLGTIPQFQQHCSWFPVDLLAQAILEIALGLNKMVYTPDNKELFNLVNPILFSWNNDFLPALREAGIQFEALPASAWVRQLRAFADEHGENAPRMNPAVKLLEFWEDRYEDPVGNMEYPEVQFVTAAAEHASPTVRQIKSRGVNIVEAGYVVQFVRQWMTDFIEEKN